MATTDDYAKWIVQNADKKGTPEFQTVAAAYQEAKAQETAAPAAKPAPPKAAPQPSWLERHGREIATTGGALLGGLVAAPAALASAPSGIGPVAIEAGGVGLGAGLGGAGYDALMVALQKAPKRTATQQVVQNVKDIGYNAAAVPGTSVALKGVKVAAQAGVAGAKTAGAKIAEALAAGKQARIAEEQAKQSVNAVRASMLQRLGTEQKVAAGGARVAGQQAGWKTAEAEANQRLQAEALKAQEAAQAQAAAAKPLGGKTTTGAETGAQTRGAIEARYKAQQAAFQKVDDELRPLVQADVAAKEAAGMSVADTPEAKALLKQSKDIMEPNVATRPGVSSVPKPNAGGTVHSMIIDALERQRIPLTEAEAKAAREAGNEVKAITTMDANGMPVQQFYRTFKTSYEALDNLGRYIGEQAFSKGEAAGFPAVSKSVLRDKYAEIQKVLNQFAGENRVKMQANWDAKLEAARPVKGTQVGKRAIEPVKGTEIPKASEEDVANAAYGSVQGYRNARNLAGPEVAKTGLVNRLKTLFEDPTTNGPLSYDQTVKLLAANNGRLQGIINEEPEVKAMVDAHLRQLNDAKMAGVKAADFGEKAKAYGTAAQEAEKAAEARATTKASFENTRRDYAAEFQNLRALPENRVIEASRSLAERMAKSGHINSAQQQQFLSQIQEAERQISAAQTAAQKKAAVDRLLKYAGGILVGSTVVGAGGKVVSALH